MKTIKKFSLMLLLVVTVFGSCKKTTVTTGLLEVVPANASFVVAMEYDNLIKKGGLNNLQDFTFYKKLQSELNHLDPVVKNTIENFFKDSKSIGLDMQKAYVYGMLQGDQFYAAAVFRMDNINTFGKSYKNCFKWAGMILSPLTKEPIRRFLKTIS